MTNCPHCHKPVKPIRSPADHRRFFALMRATFHHWPEAHEFQPSDETHLRKWLLIKAGFKDVTLIPVEFAEDQPAMLKLVSLTVEAAITAADGYAFIRPHGCSIAVFKAKSIKWDTLDQRGFHDVRTKVEEVIEAETGLKPDEILQATEDAA